MPKQYSSLFFILLFVFQLQAQNESSKQLKGKVSADTSDLEGIYVINLKTDFSTLTEKGGYFEINASVGDTLMFSSVQLKGIKKLVTKEDFEKDLFFVKMELLIRFLDEVKINKYKNINSVSLGLVSKNQKTYTPAERRLYTATGGTKNLYGTNTSVSFDGILNSISGRTQMLKSMVIVEKKEFLLSKIDYLFEDKYYTDTLKIPADYVKGFQYYIVENEKFVSEINKNNKTMATFIMNQLAVEYLELLKVK